MTDPSFIEMSLMTIGIVAVIWVAIDIFHMGYKIATSGK